MNTFQDVKDFLLSKEQGIFEPDDYIGAWFKPAVSTYFIGHAVEVISKTIRWGEGLVFQCHRNALTYASEHPGSTPWFGFQYLQWASVTGEASAASWEVHSWVVEANGAIVDSGEYVPEATRYFGVPWSWELYDLIAKKEIIDKVA